MKKTDFSPQFPTVWGAGADSTHLQYPIPGTSSALGRASLNLGFPPETFVAPEAGGSFMFGEDMNGALRMLATAAQNYESGVFPPFSASFAQSVGGYPQGCVVADPTTTGVFWVSTADNNLTTPGAPGASWVSLFAGLTPTPTASSGSVPLGISLFYSHGQDNAVRVNTTNAAGTAKTYILPTASSLSYSADKSTIGYVISGATPTPVDTSGVIPLAVNLLYGHGLDGCIRVNTTDKTGAAKTNVLASAYAVTTSSIGTIGYSINGSTPTPVEVSGTSGLAVTSLYVNGSNGKPYLNSYTAAGAATTLNLATSTDIASVKPGRLLGVNVFGGSGTYTPPRQDATLLFRIRLVGAGGGAGNTPSLGPYSGAAAGGGGAGTYAEMWFSWGHLFGATGKSVPVNIGTGGSPWSAGGSSSVGNALICPGGLAGGTTNSGSYSTISPGGGRAATATMPNGVQNYGCIIRGAPGQPGLVDNPQQGGNVYAQSGAGGSSPFGSGGEPAGAGSAGVSGDPGGGGSGACSAVVTSGNSTALTGGYGGSGWGILECYEAISA